MNRLFPRVLAAFIISSIMSAAQAAEISGARVNNMACDNFYFNITAGPKTMRVQKFAVHAYHREKTKYYVYYHSGEFAGSENDSSKWTLVSTTEVTPTGADNAFELSAGGTFLAAGQIGAFLICADLANDNGALWGGADGELRNDELTVSVGTWLTRLNESMPKHFVTSGRCSDTHGYGGVITYATSLAAKAVRITSAPPPALNIAEGQQLKLEVVVEGTGPFSYKWKKDGAEIPGATAASYVKLAALNDGGDYTVAVTGAVPPPATSVATKVTVTADRTSPAIAGISSEGGLTNVVVTFSERVDPVEAIKTSHYSFSGGVTIAGASLGETGDRVILSVSRLKSFTEYTLTAGGIPDRSLAKNPLPVNSKANFVTAGYYAYSPTTGSGQSWTQAYYTLSAAAKDVTILSFEIVAFHSAETDYLLYTKPGEFAGSEFDPSAWKLVASNHLAASNIPIPRPMGPLEVKVPAGQSQSFLIAHTAGGGTFYVGSGELVGDDFTLGVGKDYTRSGEGLFDGGEESGSRGFAGFIRYCLDVCAALAPPTLSVARDAAGFRLGWSDPTYRLQSSASLSTAGWRDVTGVSPVIVTPSGGSSFYRLIKP